MIAAATLAPISVVMRTVIRALPGSLTGVAVPLTTEPGRAAAVVALSAAGSHRATVPPVTLSTLPAA